MSELDAARASSADPVAGVWARPEVCLLNSPLTDWPVFVRWPLAQVEDALADGGDLPLPRRLRRRLIAWSRYFHQHFTGQGEWDCPHSAFCYNTMGLDLADQVATTLGGSYRVLVYLDGPEERLDRGDPGMTIKNGHR